jgi:hypothetical protein
MRASKLAEIYYQIIGDPKKRVKGLKHIYRQVLMYIQVQYQKLPLMNVAMEFGISE